MHSSDPKRWGLDPSLLSFKGRVSRQGNCISLRLHFFGAVAGYWKEWVNFFSFSVILFYIVCILGEVLSLPLFALSILFYIGRCLRYDKGLAVVWLHKKSFWWIVEKSSSSRMQLTYFPSNSSFFEWTLIYLFWCQTVQVWSHFIFFKKDKKIPMYFIPLTCHRIMRTKHELKKNHTNYGEQPMKKAPWIFRLFFLWRGLI